MQPLSIPGLIRRRLLNDWKLLLSVFVGITIATTLVAGTPVYLSALEQQGFITSLDEISAPVLTIEVSAPNVLVAPKALEKADRVIDDAIGRHLSGIYLGRESYLKGSTSLLGFPNAPLSKGGGRGVLASRGYLQSLTNLESHSRFVEGRMAADSSSPGRFGPQVEAVVSGQTAQAFNASIGDVFTLKSSLEVPTEISVQIVGVFEPGDPEEDYWQRATALLDPPPLGQEPPLLVQVDPDEPPLSLFVAENVVIELLGDFVSARLLGRERHATGPVFLVGVPGRPLPRGGGTGVLSSLGYLMNISSLEGHSRFVEGRMAGESVSVSPDGARVEAVVAGRTETRILIELGDVLTLAPTLGSDKVISAEIVGIMLPDDPEEPYWGSAGQFLLSVPLSRTIEGLPEGQADSDEEETLFGSVGGAPLLVQPDESEAPVAVLVTRPAMVEAVSRLYPGSLAEPFWAVRIDKEGLKSWTLSETRTRFKGFEDEIVQSLPGALVGTGIVRSVTQAGEAKGFLSKVPLLLLMSVMVVTALYFLMMMVSYLVQSREGDAALLRTRGLKTRQFIQLYTLEGLPITAAAVLLAPFLAIGIVASAGVLPFFSEITGGRLLPVTISAVPFLVALGAGLLCLAIFVVPGALTERGGQLMHGLRSSRPPIMPWVHRYNLDFALIVLGGLIFWELQERGHIVSGGLFEAADVNEALLLAPVLFLIAVALVFMRVFPLIMGFIGGESVRLISLIVGVSIVGLVSGIGARGIRQGEGAEWIGVVAILIALAAAYWETVRATRVSFTTAGLLAQTALVAAFLVVERPEPKQLLFVPTVGLISAVPAQLVFPVLRASLRSAPAWLSIGVWHMARNPMQYAWLVLLLVLVTGMGILATTVGDTLERSEKERVRYEVPSDLFVRGQGLRARGPDRLKLDYGDVPGVDYASPALRAAAHVGNVSVEVLALESTEFAELSWFRQDFSPVPLEDVLSKLRPDGGLRSLEIPDGATSIGLWVKPVEVSAFMALFATVGYGDGALQTVFLGQLGPGGWNLMRADIPTALEPPLHLVSVEIFEPTFGQGTPGQVLLDDIHVTLPSAGEQVLEDFEGEMRWTPIETLALPDHSVSAIAGDALGGDKAGLFSFGTQTDRGLRGFYYDPTGGPLPVVVSSSLLAATGRRPGEAFNARIADRWLQVVIEGTVDYFPTADPLSGGFILADLESLLGHHNVLAESYSARPNEAFIRSSEAGHVSAREGLAALLGRHGSVQDVAGQLRSLSLDPFVSAGWKPMQFLAPAIGGLAAAVGYVTYLLLFTKRSWHDMGFLHVIGLSRHQLRGLLGFQHLSMAAVGVGLGTWAGSYMSRLLVSPLAVTETGLPVVPPFVISTDWAVMIANYAVLMLVFLAALYVLNRAVAGMKLHTLRGFGEI